VLTPLSVENMKHTPFWATFVPALIEDAEASAHQPVTDDEFCLFLFHEALTLSIAKVIVEYSALFYTRHSLRAKIR